MQKEDLRKIFNQPYNRENWIRTLEATFKNVSIFKTPRQFTAPNDKINSFAQLGSIRLNDGKSLALFEVILSDNVNGVKNKVELRKLVDKYIDMEQAHGVLSIYEQGGEDYRFTFAAKSNEFDEEKGEFISKETDRKRYTYVLGKNESCKTAADQFYNLSQNKENTTIKEVQDAFNVDKLSKQFFTDYKNHYEKLVNFLVNPANSFKTSIFKDDEKHIRDFVKILLGRLVFIQFIQKKGWMGVDKNSPGWKNGQVNFLHQAFKSFEHKDQFHSQFLYPLFFEALNQADRPNDVFELTQSKVPYLNGGLFENEEPITRNVDFPKAYFEALLEFFDQYNFTIDENDPEEREVGIDPEMLGHIFENLLEDNKDKGAFYTPKEIVHYMCQESLKEYLKTFLEQNSQWPTDTEQATTFEDNLHLFVTKKQAGGVIELDEPLAIALRDVKICDPAIGSGAFPMGLLNEIFQCMYVLHSASPDVVGQVWKMDDWQPNVVKLNIIQNSIYGVDIEKGAVDIARLRFWLSLIVDEPEPKALPNLDYKIVVGNSLVNKFDNEVLDINWDVTNRKGSASKFYEKLHESLLQVSDKQKEFFQSNNKEHLKHEIRNLKIEAIFNQISLNKEIYAHRNPTILDTGFGLKPKEIQKNLEINLTLKGFDKMLYKLEKLKAKPEDPLHFFDWKLDFPEVMNEQVVEKVGFDIVIGNPPYVSAVTMARNEETKKYFKEKYPLATGSYDLYLLFILKALNLSNNSGTYTWIIPNKFLIADYARMSRINLIEHYCLRYSINVSKFNVFEGIGVYPIIILGNKHFQEEFSEFLLENYGDLEQRKFVSPIPLKKHKTLKDYGIKINAGATGFQAEQLKDIVSNNENIGSIPFTVSGNIDRYKWSNESVRYMGEKYTNAFINNSKEIVADSKWKFWAGPKIVIAGMTKVIEAVYVEFPLGLGVGIYGIYDFRGYDPYCLTAILNSKYLTYYFLIKFKDKHLAGGYLAINKSTIEEFPLIEISKSNQKKLSDLSKNIHKFRLENKSISHLENEIDNLVYKLYELTYEEVKVIDPEFSLSEQEYEAISIE